MATPAARRSVAAAAASSSSKRATPRLANAEDDVALRPASLTSFTDGGAAEASIAYTGDLVVLGVWADDLEGAKSEEAEDEQKSGEEDEEDADADAGADAPPPTTPLFTDATAVAWDDKSGGLLSDAARAGGFKGRAGQSASVRLPRGAGGGPKALVVVGLGRRAAAAAGDPAWGVSPFAGLGGAVSAAAKAHKAKAGGVVVCGGVGGAAPPAAAAALARGLLTGAHAATRFKHGPGPSRLGTATLYGLPPGAVAGGVAEGGALARGITLARYLVEAPPNVCTPSHVARAAEAIAASAPDVLTCRLYGRAECEAMGMGAFLGVSAASARPPVLIHLTYTPPGGPAAGPGAPPPLALVGKGITFDSGGYNLKVGGMIEMMKFDMAGAGAVLGAADALAAARPAGGPTVHLIAACCENLIGPASLLPGDILATASGKTVEVNNTDAEGRLILADAIWFAQERAGGEGEGARVGAVVDIATLTGERAAGGWREGARSRSLSAPSLPLTAILSLSLSTRILDPLQAPAWSPSAPPSRPCTPPTTRSRPRWRRPHGAQAKRCGACRWRPRTGRPWPRPSRT
jgi:leucyl aminopeptidase